MNLLSAASLTIYLPFVLLLLSIAVMPLAFPAFWEKNRNKAIVVLVLSLPVLIFLIASTPKELTAVFRDYASFILLLASLYVISGGIRVTGDIRATPAVNTGFLLVGAVMANLIGTTGASMLLIRPLLKTIGERKHISHIPVFFIMIVSNIGGCLTPLGDPPLFLGYLKGVPFLWTLSLFPVWATTVGILLIVFYVWDSICYRRETKKDIRKDREAVDPIRISGKRNFLFLAAVIATIFFQVPSPYRELAMTFMIGISLVFTRKEVRKGNGFTFNPMIEVAVLFAGIFVTMVPLLTLLQERGAEFGIAQPWQFFWLSGGLSSFLDNAPTYLTFSSLAKSVTASAGMLSGPAVAGIRTDLLRALSCGAVFMGANTYIGNGPNFMVKSIAEEQKVKMPHFFGYMGYSFAILIPVFILVTKFFFR